MTTVRKLNLPRVMAGKHLVWPSLSTGKIFGRLVFKSLSLTLLLCILCGLERNQIPIPSIVAASALALCPPGASNRGRIYGSRLVRCGSRRLFVGTTPLLKTIPASREKSYLLEFAFGPEPIIKLIA